jgi:hypothetical protein
MILEEEVGTSKIHEIGIRQPQAQREQDAGQEPPLAAPANPSTSFDVQQMVSQHEGGVFKSLPTIA